MNRYAILVVPLDDRDGGGYLGIVPDLYGCLSDGETPDEALANTRAAMADWLAVAEATGREVPLPGRAADRARERERALLETIKVLSEQFGTLDERIEGLSRELEHLSEVIDGQEAWLRLDRLQVGVAARDPRPAAATC